MASTTTFNDIREDEFPKWDNDQLLTWGNVIIIVALLLIAAKIAAILIGMFLVYKKTRSLWKPFVFSYPSVRWFFYDTLISWAAGFGFLSMVKKFWKPTENRSSES